MKDTKKQTDKSTWLIKNWSNILFVILLILFLIPSTRFKMQVYINNVFSFSPSIDNERDWKQLNDYNWQLIDSSGQHVNLSQSKNKIILINYWASWCGPCVAEMPSLQQLYNRHNKDVDFYFIARDEPKAIKDFMQKNDYIFPVFYEQQNPPAVLQNNKLPTTYLIDQKGNIRIFKTGAANWNSEKINTFLSQLLK